MQKIRHNHLVRYASIFAAFLILLAVGVISVKGSAWGEAPGRYAPISPTPRAADPRGEPAPLHEPTNPSAAPGYCSSSGGSTEYESISSASLTRNPDNSMKLTVQIFIANPTGCTTGSECPEYDNSPEYVNAWIDWDGDSTWAASERVMDKALTGYQAINYYGGMVAVSQFSAPSGVTITDEPTWLRVNLGWNYDPNNPCDVSWTWGDVLDKQIHLNFPKINTITAVGVGTTDNNPETGSQVRLEADIEVPDGYQLTACSWVGQLTPGDGDTANNCRYEYEPATGAGPSLGTYGEKTVTLIVTSQHTASGASSQTSKSHDYKVFFEKTGDDDGDGVPNWFEYWGDDDAVPGLDDADVEYDSSCPAGYICYGAWRYPPNDNIYVKDGAAGTHYAAGIDVPAVADTCPGGNFGGAQGIDSAAEVLAHENRHKTIYHNWDAGGIWEGETDSDTDPSPHGRPGDDLPDTYETDTLGTDPNDVDSCDMATAKGVASYAQYGDNEFDAVSSSDGETGNEANDWANPGKQSDPAFFLGQDLVGGEVNSAATSGAAWSLAPFANFGPLAFTDLGSLTGSYSDVGLDTDADGLYNSLQLSVGVQIDVAGEYYVIAWIEDGSSTEVAWASAGATWTVGTHSIDVLFSGLDIRDSGLNGPYNVARVELRVVDDDALVDEANDAHTTAAYAYTDFENPDVGIAGSFSDLGVDTGSDGLYDLLRINVELSVQVAGTYKVIGELEGSDVIAVVSSTQALATGTQNVDLDFSGESVYQSRKDGPYNLRRLRVEDTGGDPIDFVYHAYATSAYTHSQFQHAGVTFDAASYSDQGVDVDSDGDYDYLRVSFSIQSDQTGTYNVFASLNNGTDTKIVDKQDDLALSVGANSATLDFPGGPIYDSAFNGPYEVVSLSLVDGEGGIIDFQPSAHTTQAYLYTDFAPPLISSPSDYQDSGQDTDGDGKFNYLNIVITVVPGEAGVVFAEGRLMDGIGGEIGWAQASETMTAGSPQTITLAYAGGTIVYYGQPGPYELHDLLLYHSADPGQDVFISQAYTTAGYSLSDFDTFTIYLPLVSRAH